MPVRSPSSSTRPAKAPIAEKQSPLSFGRSTGLYFALALVYFLPALLPGRHLFGTDYLAGTFFYWSFIADALKAGQLPAWVPYVYGGVPLFASPGSTFYPPWLLLALVLPTSKVMPALFILQFTVAGAATYLLLRELGARRWVAFVTGLAFEFTGLMMSFVYAGHDGRTIVATFAPLVFFLLHRGIRTGEIRWFVGLATTLGFSLLSFQIQSNYYLLLAAGLWGVFLLWHLAVFRDARALSRRLALAAGALLIAFLLAAVNFLPFLDYIDASPRGGEGGRGYEYATSWAMPPGEILGLAVPEAHGVSVADETGSYPFGRYTGTNPFKLHTEYAGALVLLLLVLGAAYSRRERVWWFFAGLAVFGLSFAFGASSPLYRLYYEFLPGTDKFRAPSIAFFLVSVALAAMAGLTLEQLARARASSTLPARRKASETAHDQPKLLWWLGGYLGLLVLAMLLSGGGSEAGSAASRGWFRFTLFSAGFAALIWTWFEGKLASTGAAIGLALLVVVDLWIVDRPFFQTVDGPEYMFAQDDVSAFLASQPETGRVWTLPFPPGGVYRNGGNYLMLFGIDQAGGEHPNPLQRYYEYVGAGEQSYTDWHNLLTYPQFMAAANIRYLISGAPLEVPGFGEVHRGSAIIYENLSVLPRAYLVPRVVPVEGGAAALRQMENAAWNPAETAFVTAEAGRPLPNVGGGGTARVVESTPDRVVVDVNAESPAFLVLGDNYYPGWTATVAGAEEPVFRTNHTLRGVPVPAGRQQVVFEFHSAGLQIGYLIYFAGLVLLAAYAAWLLIAHRRGRETGASSG